MIEKEIIVIAIVYIVLSLIFHYKTYKMYLEEKKKNDDK
jgi:hypothetical protein